METIPLKNHSITKKAKDFILNAYPKLEQVPEKLSIFIIAITDYVDWGGIAEQDFLSNMDLINKYPKLFQVPRKYKFAYRGISIHPGDSMFGEILDIIFNKYNTITHEAKINRIKYDGVLSNYTYNHPKSISMSLNSWSVDEKISWKFATTIHKGSMKLQVKQAISDFDFWWKDNLESISFRKELSKITSRDFELFDMSNIPCVIEAPIDKTFFMNPEFTNAIGANKEFEIIRNTIKPVRCNLWIPADIVKIIRDFHQEHMV